MKFKFLSDSPLLCKRHHVESELLKNLRISEYVCSRKCVPKNCGRIKSQLIASFGMGFCDNGELSKASASNEMSDNEDKQMTPMGEYLVTSPVIILCNDSPESPLRQEHRDLCENVLPVVHPCWLLVTETRKRFSLLSNNRLNFSL